MIQVLSPRPIQSPHSVACVLGVPRRPALASPLPPPPSSQSLRIIVLVRV